ncbi:complex I subunit 5 family protein [Aquabacter sp. CN5-332]|uniref:complex I subunit 5 family protein n=1 Tax=Aquabacter sp. CN5-332 TaxID=3156608 RepID=UPI0032B53BE1
MTYLLAAAPFFPFLLALLCILPQVRRHAMQMLAFAPVPGLAAALLAPGGVLILPPAPFRITLFLDTPGAILLGTSSLLWIAAGAYASTYMRGDEKARGFAVWWLLTLAGSQGVFLVADLTSFYLAFALVSLAAYGLAAHEDNAAARQAGILYLVLTLVSEALLIMAFVMLASGAGGNPDIREVVAALPLSPWRDAIITLLVLGFGLKMGLVPLHVWMPLAHSVAPVPASAVLSGIVVKAGVIGLMRFLPFGDVLPGWGGLLVVSGLVTAYFGILVGLTQTHPKTVLAYSTVSQMGVVAVVLGAGLTAGDEGTVVAAALYAANHVLLKGALFLGVGVVLTTPRDRLWPLALLALTGFSLAGLPLTGGMLAKVAIKGPLGDGTAALLLTLSAAGTTLLMLRFLERLRAAATGEETGAPKGLLIPWAALAGTALVAPYVLLPLATGDAAWAVVSLADLWNTLWPVLLGLALAAALRSHVGRLPAIPPGDVVVLAKRLGPTLTASMKAADRMEGTLRRWPAAMLLLVAITLLLAAVTSGR